MEVLNLDKASDSKREVVNDELLSGIRTKIRDAGDDLSANRLPRLATWCSTCDRCDLVGWNFQTVILEQDLVLTPDEGAAKITQDEMGNTYDRVGGPFSNYKP